MSLVGIDMGSSSVKIAAYTEQGSLLAVVNNNISPLHPHPGWWETDPLDVWQATEIGLRQIMLLDVVRKDPPKALAISASGRENFLMDAAGNPLTNNIMGADVRGVELETPPPGAPVPEPWTLSCGHLRERMDPVFRLQWWRKNHPELLEKASTYPDWHGWLTYRLCDRNVSERSLVGRWLIYDLKSKTWSPERMAEYQVDEKFLPELLPWGTPIDKISPRVAKELGLPADLVIVTGGHDLNCAGVGSGSSVLGSACLISGSYENMLIPTDQYPSASMLLNGLSITPHLGSIERSVYAICPTGNAVLNWARDLVKISLNEQEGKLSQRTNEPSPIMALPYLSGAMLFWQGGRKLRGVLLGMTLATEPTDVVQAFMEAIAYDHVNTLSLLKKEGIPVDHIRATGGGTRSTWWTQLKSDMLQVPIEVVAEPESGALGAALLAGVGIGIFHDLDEASRNCSGTSRVHYPNPERAALHQERYALYCKMVPTLLSTAFEYWV